MSLTRKSLCFFHGEDIPQKGEIIEVDHYGRKVNFLVLSILSITWIIKEEDKGILLDIEGVISGIKNDN